MLLGWFTYASIINISLHPHISHYISFVCLRYGYGVAAQRRYANPRINPTIPVLGPSISVCKMSCPRPLRLVDLQLGPWGLPDPSSRSHGTPPPGTMVTEPAARTQEGAVAKSCKIHQNPIDPIASSTCWRLMRPSICW